MIERNLTRYIKISFILIGVLIIGFMAYRYIAPFGKIVYYRFTSNFPGTQEATIFSPGKDSILKIPAQIITTSKSKLQLKLLSSDVELIKATLKFKPTVNEIVLGIRGNEKDNFFYRPLYRDLLHYLNWEKVEEGGFTLWQKEKKYQTLYDFVNNPPQDKKTASYFVDLSKLSILKSTEVKEEAKTVIETPLRASHTLLIRVDKKPLVLKVTKQDMNGYEGEDKLKISVLKGETSLIEKTIIDDGIVDASRLKAEPQEETISLGDIESGIYLVNLFDESGKGDILITKIEINQSKVILKNRIFILGEKPTVFWTNSQKVNIFTAHDVGLQSVKLNDQYDLKIEERDKQYPFDLAALTGNKDTNKLYKLESPKNDLIFEGNGYFSFTEESFFLPEPIKAIDLSSDVSTLTNLDEVDYVLTTYIPPKKEGDWLAAEASFDPKQIKIEGDKLYFSLEVPQIAKYGGELEIDYLEIVVKSKGALEKPTPTPTSSPSVSSGQASPTPSPTPTPSFKSSLLVRVLNGGGEKGAALKLATSLKESGFTNVLATNADKFDYKNAIVRYREENKKEVDKIVELLKNDYKTIDQNLISTTSAEIVVILGLK